MPSSLRIATALRSRRRAPCRGQRGFTLIELLVVLVILGLLAALAGPRVVNYLAGAKTDSARLQIENLKSVLDLYRIDTGSYPSTQQGLQALVRNPGNVRGWRQGYLDSAVVPVDPWGYAFVYRSPSDRGAYELSSLGSDNSPGGNGEAADVTSWTR